ncbi:MAG: AAA family ATPase [Alphaproteobacteria bacterium]|nr:AAA family ATPase [Alphaproteobacteria bacterium]
MSKSRSQDRGETPFGAALQDRPIPRVSIHAFCESPETGAVIQRAGQDRRLAKAHLTVHMGGVFGAVEYFGDSSTPNVIMVETREQGNAIFGELEKLAQVCDPGTKVIVIGRSNDVALYRELIRQGISEYLVSPLNPIQVIEAVASLYHGQSSGPIGKVFAFYGARGGSGSSTFAHNVAWSIAEDQRIATTVIDFDVPFGTTGLDFNQDIGQGIAEALTSPERLDEVMLERLLLKHTDRLSLLISPALVDREMDISPEAVDIIIDAVRQISPCVIIDLPHSWSNWVKQVLSSADEIVITATPELSSLRNGKNLHEMLTQSRPNDQPLKFALNQVGVPKRPEIPVKDFANAMGCDPSVVMPFDPQIFATANNNGQMLAELNAQSRPAQLFRDLGQVLTGRAPRVDAKPTRGISLDFLRRKRA